MPTAFVLLNSDLGSDVPVIEEVKRLLSAGDVRYEVRGVYGIYDIIVKLSAPTHEEIRAVITERLRRIPEVQSTLTMMVVEGQGS
ncbi:MAG: Lrp/AsnC ligand binding domain-containing protein [Nitrosopumilus sp.]|nr:Lrp/AsnC ligand binding domain-containing protein [Nitrosopumilus sp.]CAI9830858.1 Transcriptional regulator, AsnC family [Nitrosopumilaceae archaeon]MDA7941113.1 Lrp/AsnC ligand binding domain-containing protein [Nitrosopumilus sp.]MDA7942489.1 Lrp/AsnC ligand binding domain-containing protein [Nitrosopumilus sp.]MDA7944552.1 Lrp/AsnC ligand binding domain-containing protein [Nitrosopumilus sp.]